MRRWCTFASVGTEDPESCFHCPLQDNPLASLELWRNNPGSFIRCRGKIQRSPHTERAKAPTATEMMISRNSVATDSQRVDLTARHSAVAVVQRVDKGRSRSHEIRNMLGEMLYLSGNTPVELRSDSPARSINIRPVSPLPLLTTS